MVRFEVMRNNCAIAVRVIKKRINVTLSTFACQLNKASKNITEFTNSTIEFTLSRTSYDLYSNLSNILERDYFCFIKIIKCFEIVKKFDVQRNSHPI